jgi:hypothetical protein
MPPLPGKLTPGSSGRWDFSLMWINSEWPNIREVAKLYLASGADQRDTGLKNLKALASNTGAQNGATSA